MISIYKYKITLGQLINVIVINIQRVGNAFVVQLLGLSREPKLHKVTIMCQNLHKPVFIGYKSLPKASWRKNKTSYVCSIQFHAYSMYKQCIFFKKIRKNARQWQIQLYKQRHSQMVPLIAFLIQQLRHWNKKPSESEIL